jgi:phosphatidylglycerol lysyltransferase
MFKIKTMKRTDSRSMSVKIIGALVASMGVINLLSAVTPSLPSRVAWLQDLFPIEIRHSAHLFTALSGFWLLILATGLLRRKRMAWMLSMGFLSISIVFNLIKGLDIEESLFAAILLVLLVATRQLYTARSDAPSIAQGAKALLASGLFTLAYGTAGFFLLDRAYRIKYDVPGAALQTLLMFIEQDNAGIVPITRFAQFFADSIYCVGGITLLYALWMLLRPMLLRGEPASDMQHRQAKAIVELHGHSSLAAMTLLNDKAYFFSSTGKSVIAYVPKGRAVIALGDPIGPPEEAAEVLRGFQDFCRLNDWLPGFYQTQPDLLDLYRQLGFRALKIGEEAVVDLSTFTISGKSGQDLRSARNKLSRLGHRIEFHQPPLSRSLLEELRVVSDEWLGMMKGSEKRFSVGWFDETYLMATPVALIRTPDGTVSAFANLVSSALAKGITIDLMRHRENMLHGTMDFLFLSLFQYGKDRGYQRFHLGLSALSGVGETARSARIEKVIHYLYEHLNQFYNFKGLHAYKDKFRPRWEPRYLVFPGYASLMQIVVALIRADSGDRWIDYFKPDV